VKKIFILFLICLYFKGFSQFQFNDLNGRIIDFRDLNGRSLLKVYESDIKGYPFINDDWVAAKLTLSNGKQIEPVLIKLNIESNELYFRDSSDKIFVAVDGLVKKVECINYYSKDSIKYVFKNGYPNVDNQDQKFFYQVLTEGKVELLMKHQKIISSDKNDLTGDVSKEFTEQDKLYVYTNYTTQSFAPYKSFVLSLMRDREKEMSSFIEANKINLKKNKDLILLFNYYNNLFK